jgi:adenosylcobinamide kinase / adenosylcobinamide-phosphate guanylyltransferase
MIKNTYLITGGSRSGKSRYALELAKSAKKPFYIATAGIGDEEMKDRIIKHQAERGEHWTTIEEQIDLAYAIQKANNEAADFIIVDCLTLWISNIMFKDTVELEFELDKLKLIIKKIDTPLVLVTNEVGCGIVPDNPLAREFRDTAGIVNQEIAKMVDNVILTVSGIPMVIKGQ